MDDQPPRRSTPEASHRTRRPGGRGPETADSTVLGRWIRSCGAHAVGASLPESGQLGERIRRGPSPPVTAGWAATCRNPWSTRHAWTSSAGGPAWCCWLAPKPGARTGLRAKGGKLECAGRIPFRFAVAGSKRSDGRCGWIQPGPAGLRVPDIRAGAAHRLRRVDQHRKRIGGLWARFSAVAADNPHAWIRNPVTADEI